MGGISETPEERHARETFVSVNDYVGEGYRLPDGQRNDPIAKEKFEEIASATEQFFLDKYKTEVIVHNAVGAKHGIMVFVESPNEPRFHTFAMMPVDAKEGKIFIEDIWTVEMQVEQALFGGLLAMIMEEEFAALDQYIEELVENYPVIGMRPEAVSTVTKSGYTTPFYFIQALSLREDLERINRLYLDNPLISKEELKNQFDIDNYNAEKLTISIELFMEDHSIEPDESIIQKIINDIKKVEGLPRGAYSVALHDNNISKLTGIGDKDNSLIEGNIVQIIRK
ncbi:DUF1672 family protein [Metabacillus lacus]|nr:DUF1672 family protein [Metabacillus lacus]